MKRVILYSPPESVDPDKHVIIGASIIQAVEALGHNMLIDQTTLEQVRDLGNEAKNGIKVRYTHPGLSSTGLGKFLGRAKNFRINESGDKTLADIHLSESASRSPEGDLRAYIESLAAEDAEAFGMSIVFSGEKVWKRKNGEEWSARKHERPSDATTKIPLARVVELHAADAVDEPAANRDGMFGAFGKTTSVLASEAFAAIDKHVAETGISPSDIPQLTQQFFTNPDLLKQDNPITHALGYSLTSAFPVNEGDAVSLAWRYALSRKVRPAHLIQGQQPTNSKEAIMPTEQEQEAPVIQPTQEAVDAALTNAIEGNQFVLQAQQAAIKQIINGQTDLLQSQREVLLSQTFSNVEELQKAIDQQKKVLSDVRAGANIDMGGDAPRQPNITMGLTSLDQYKAAFLALMNGQRPQHGVRPLSGIREAYMLATGDWELHGRFHDDRVSLAAVTTTTFSELVAEHINKIVVSNMQMLGKWWEAGVTTRNFSSLKDIHWVKVSGIGELPTVQQGQNYTELKWDTQEETAGFVKKGGYLGLTLEAIDADDTGWMQNAGPALARAAWLTLGKDIASIFTTNANMADGDPLFHANHGNTAALALTDANYRAVKIAMQKQTDYAPTGGQAQERLGGILAPRMIWSPIDLEDTALQILASVPVAGTTNTGDENPDAVGDTRSARLAAARARLITVPFWTSATGWYAQADKMIWPSVGLGYRFGEQPELFSVQDPKAGLVFSNDVFPVKVRFFYATGAMDYKGLYRGNS